MRRWKEWWGEGREGNGEGWQGSEWARSVWKELILYFKLMKSDREIVSVAAMMAEMVLQSRVSPHPAQLQRLQSVGSEVELARHHLHPSDELLYFLVDREYYQIKSKLNAQQRKSPKQPLILTITFTVFDKETSLSQTAENWKIAIHRKPLSCLQPSACLHEMIGLVGQTVKHLTRPYNFSELIRNREASKKYIIDYRVEVGSEGRVDVEGEFAMWNSVGRMNETYEAEISCYYRPSLKFSHVGGSPYAATHQLKKRNNSEETRVDSCSISSLRDINTNSKRYRSISIDQQQMAFEVYDQQLEMTIISSDSDSLSHSRHAIQEITLGEVDQFELLIEEEMNEDELFLIDNQAAFQGWQKYLSLNFH